MLDVKIRDGGGSANYTTLKQYRDQQHGLVVSTRPYSYQEFRRMPISSTLYGENMNITQSFGTPVFVHNGIDNTYWTGTNVSGTPAVFNSTTQAYAGTRSVYWQEPGAGSIIQFAKGSAQSLTGYVAVTMWIYIESGWDATETNNIYGWNTVTSSQVGVRVNLGAYCNVLNTGVWQKITIPFTSMGLVGSTIYAFRFISGPKVGGKNPAFYIDSLQIEQLAVALGEYSAEPPRSSIFFMNDITLFLSDVYNPVLAGSSVPVIDHNKLLGVPSLNNGITIAVSRRNIIRYSLNFKNISQFITAGGYIVDMGYDGTSETWLQVRLKFDFPIAFASRFEDKLTVLITDDLSGLTNCIMSVSGGIEYEAVNEHMQTGNAGIKDIY